MGSVLGIVTTDVTPPAKAALLKVLKFLYIHNLVLQQKLSYLLDLEIYTLFLRSIIFSLDGILFVLTFLPIASIDPFSPIIKPPFSFSEL